MAEKIIAGTFFEYWVSALLAFSRDGSAMQRAWPELLLIAVIQVAERLTHRQPWMCLWCDACCRDLDVPGHVYLELACKRPEESHVAEARWFRG